MDEKRFGTLMTLLSEMYDKQISSNLSKIYYDILSKHLTIEEFEKAIETILTTRKYSSFPKPAEIIETVKNDPHNIPLLAWQTALNAIDRYSYYQSVNFEDVTINRVIDAMGGWMQFSTFQKDEIGFVQKRFIDFYNAMKFRTDSPQLKGFLEDKNKVCDDLKRIPCDYLNKEKLVTNGIRTNASDISS